ncbi:MAG: hypothetical protein A3C36_04995 [Omnitrophica WOR_2 bacterium RIFCSPHIGHO2_02_FULL_52_10]|nr:MAG: hypothetical protein A3C36_04995 [Omnitrophica WOR_2 bacterium RIFCSPHIGHO2_02_FULL_52_10]
MSKRKILIIDDERGFCEIVKLNLEATELFEVAIETDSCHAREAALRCHPDLILLDVIMANKEGPDVIVELKASPSLKDIPVVFLTATVTPQEAAMGNGVIGGHPFVAKPSNLEILLKAIEKNLAAV